jgi:hypothetical protein
MGGGTMSNRLRLSLSVPDGGEAAWEFVGDGYGYDAVMAMFTASDCTEDVIDPDGEHDRLVFATTAQIAADRLACYGFTRARSLRVGTPALTKPVTYPSLHARHHDGEILADRVDAWIGGLIDPEGANSDGERGGALVHELMTGCWDSTDVFPMLDGLALILRALPDDTVVQVDLSATNWAYEREDGGVFLRDYLPIELGSLTAASVLCEGVFDSRVIEFAIRKTHPHLLEHLEVAKFDFNREGSSSALSRLVRGLADVRATGPRGIEEAPRIIAVFDADRAGVLEAQRLRQANVPSNFTVLTLPSTEDLRSYPVLGPNGIEHHDVNGWGAAIETYLAIELGVTAPLVLSYDWGAAGGYQGALLKEGKAAVQRAFDLASTQRDDWPLLASIVRHIVSAPGI